ncbi:hypothetical protein SAMN04515667_0325 [Formosa sp. Hel1_31_208]|uniref:DUF6428 family protein n=1 Tax=Formosa sp. Hel1_31_208 TaxID=1798225 RepID=UPI00087DCF93|nr:DUF6428 family protein [Formosa sp. Hel1_31_208]SDR69349.1 hypothetical protein SAMN04515667_0325 [Formosa sp. Hel1_31_208]
MKTQDLFSLLEQHKDKALLFEYAPNCFVGTNYHITEVKHITIDSVDCGAQTDSWKETIIQLWESPNDIENSKHMSVLKALGILKKVGQMKPYILNAEVKFEYSNSSFHTAQLFVNQSKIDDGKLIIQLGIEKTDCKAKDTCGIAEPAMEQETQDEPCCSPTGNCC